MHFSAITLSAGPSHSYILSYPTFSVSQGSVTLKQVPRPRVNQQLVGKMQGFYTTDLQRLGHRMKNLAYIQDEENPELHGAIAAYARVKAMAEAATPDPCLRKLVMQCEALDWYRDNMQQYVDLENLSLSDLVVECDHESVAEEHQRTDEWGNAISVLADEGFHFSAGFNRELEENTEWSYAKSDQYNHPNNWSGHQVGSEEDNSTNSEEEHDSSSEDEHYSSSEQWGESDDVLSEDEFDDWSAHMLRPDCAAGFEARDPLSTSMALPGIWEGNIADKMIEHLGGVGIIVSTTECKESNREEDDSNESYDRYQATRWRHPLYRRGHSIF